ncbi:BLOC-1-related complex subunit 8 homolog isoform X1 [Octopus bimaculoides]|uniref:BLOC-1-related complex subunit 8 homolog isoform X1 n=1 Tax=Octopus bimaculoides TaxID=37653 RepID=UPI00071CDF27|nr:BLOC-1-related complex subunit 8 homolog isoform X1 [Octopus bimaculoides]|eukprot:XP_014787275.1 PREDICTED: protein MEF2BNB homolog isoform X1 [Octopus bimaculoides]
MYPDLFQIIPSVTSMDRLAVQYKLRGALLNRTNNNNNNNNDKTQPPQSKTNDSEMNDSEQKTVGENRDTSKAGSDGLLRRVSGGSQSIRENLEPELEHKARKVSERFSENLHIITNEPSLAFFRIQEHVRKSLPQLVEQKHEVQEIHQNVQGACFDTEYAKNAVNAMQNSNVHFQNIQDLLKNAMFMKQQIEYEESRKTTNNTNRQEKKMTRSRSHSKPDNSRKSSASASVKSKRATSELAKKPL